MKVLLKIGYDTFLLPGDSGLQTVVKALSQAIRVHDYTYRREDPHIEVGECEPIEISVKYLPARTKIRSRKGAVESEPQLRLNRPSSIIIPPGGAA